MSALVTSTIPSLINTYERLLVWVAYALCSAIGVPKRVNVVEGQPQRSTCSVSIVETSDGVRRFAIEAYIPCDFDGLSDRTKRIWMNAQDVTSASPHVNFGSN
jgi:hypothetical protein